jgi:hypothetical protein
MPETDPTQGVKRVHPSSKGEKEKKYKQPFPHTIYCTGQAVRVALSGGKSRNRFVGNLSVRTTVIVGMSVTGTKEPDLCVFKLQVFYRVNGVPARYAA